MKAIADRCRLFLLAALTAPIGSASASEELIAVTTCSTEGSCSAEPTVFGRVEISFTAGRGEEGTMLKSLAVRIDGKLIEVPQAALNSILKIAPAAVQVSSEIGYPSQGLGPNLYVSMPGVCAEARPNSSGPTTCLFTFTKKKFVSLQHQNR